MASDKTEQPTELKLKDLRKDGQVAQSQEFNGSLAMLGSSLVFAVGVGAFGQSLMASTREMWSAAGQSPPTPQQMRELAMPMLFDVAKFVLLMFGVGALLACIGSILQTGGLVAPKALVPKAQRFNPVQNLKQKLFSYRPLVELLKSVLKFAIVACALGVIIWSEREPVLELAAAHPAESAHFVFSLAKRMLFVTTLLFIALSLSDIAYQRWAFQRDNRMSKSDIQDEQKRYYGDEQHKQKRKQAMKEYLELAEANRAADAQVVVTNPTHVAVALRYDPTDNRAPIVLARGRGEAAAKIRGVAEQHGVAIFQDIPLARTLVKTPVDHPVPVATYEAVAVALQWAEQLAIQQGKQMPWTQRPRGMPRAESYRP